MARRRRSLVFLVVLMLHAALVLLAARPAQQRVPPTAHAVEPLVLLYLHAPAAGTGAAAPAAPAGRVETPKHTQSRGEAVAHEATPVPKPDLQPPDLQADVQPPANPPLDIDWISQVHLAAQSSVAAAEQAGRYRDLSKLSTAQQDWIKKNHLEPAVPGIAWTHPRVEFDNGLPIIWINDHCVAVPALMMMVFCGIGHIEANGDLFKHMHDPREPSD
jgi:hypothetical protein